MEEELDTDGVDINKPHQRKDDLVITDDLDVTNDLDVTDDLNIFNGGEKLGKQISSKRIEQPGDSNKDK